MSIENGTVQGEIDRGWLRGPRRGLLESLLAHGGRATTSTLESDTGNSNVNYHLGKLAEHDLVRVEPAERTEAGQLADVYRLTDAGEETLDSLDERGNTMVAITELDARLRDIEQAGDVGELVDSIDRIENRQDALESRLDDLESESDTSHSW